MIQSGKMVSSLGGLSVFCLTLDDKRSVLQIVAHGTEELAGAGQWTGRPELVLTPPSHPPSLSLSGPGIMSTICR